MIEKIDFSKVTDINTPYGNITKLYDKNNVLMWQRDDYEYIDYFDSEEGYHGKKHGGAYLLPFRRGMYEITCIGAGGKSRRYPYLAPSRKYKGFTGGSSPVLDAKFTLPSNKFLEVNVGEMIKETGIVIYNDSELTFTGNQSDCKTQDNEIYLICPHGCDGSLVEDSRDGAIAGGEFIVKDDWSNIEFKGVTPISSVNGKNGKKIDGQGVVVSFDLDGSGYSTNTYPYGSSARFQETGGDRQINNLHGYVKIWRISRSIAYFSEDTAVGTVSGNVESGEYELGTSVSLTATVVKSNYAFDGWYSGETKISSDSPYNFSLADDTFLVAKFKRLDKVGGVWRCSHGDAKYVSSTDSWVYPKDWYCAGNITKRNGKYYANFTLLIGEGIIWSSTGEADFDSDTIYCYTGSTNTLTLTYVKD